MARKNKATTEAVTETTATTQQDAATAVLNTKVHRLHIQRTLPAALSAIFNRAVPRRFAVIGREAGFVDVFLPKDYAKNVADFVAKVERACASIGIGFSLMNEPAPAVSNTQYSLRFTNDLLTEQANWGARGYGRAVRAFEASTPATPPAEEVTLNTNKGKGRKAGARKGGRKATARS